MPGELSISLSTLFGFLLVLTRVGGIFIFMPIPGARAAGDVVRVVMVVAITIGLVSFWPAVNTEGPVLGHMAGWVLQEFALGLTIGLSVSFITDALLLAAQIVGLQAGFTFASTIDPNTQADSTVLLMFMNLIGGLLFFSLGFDRQVIQALVASLKLHPAGQYVLTGPTVESVTRLAGGIFSTGLRVALPIVAMLMMVDIALALMNRVNASLQLLMLALPVKILGTFLLFGWIAILLPRIFRGYGTEVLAVVRRVTGF